MSGESLPSPRPPRWPFAVALASLVADQLTKRWAVGRLMDPPDVIQVIPGFFDFRYAENTGAAFSLLEDQPLFLTVFSVVVFGLMVVFRDHLFSRTRLEQVAFGLIMGGVVGNMMDRMSLGYVVDFIHWHWAERGWDWPIFNIADSVICVGVGLYILSGFLKPASGKKPAPDPESAPEG